MFKTMDGVSVYDKQDVDTLVQPIEANATEAKELANNVMSRKLDKSEANIAFSEDRARLAALETEKATKAELQTLVSEAINAAIQTKLNAIMSDINHIVDNAIDDELENYDNKSDVTSKITNAIQTALQSYDTAELAASKVTNAIQTALQNYDTSSVVNSKISTATNGMATQAYVNNAIAAIPATAEATSADVTAIVNQYF